MSETPHPPRPGPGHPHPHPHPSRGHRSPRVRVAAWLAARRDGLPARLAPRTDRARRATAAAGAVVLAWGLFLAIAGLPGVVTGLPPSPPRPVAAPNAVAPSAHTSSPHRTPFHCPESHSARSGGTAPAQICIPRIRVDASVMKLGLNDDNTVEVPPLSRVGDAGWYKYSAAPGTVGPTVILGHVDSAQYGEGVFFQISRLHRGDIVRVTRGDGKLATFTVDRVTEQSKGSFPTRAVYGATSGPAIRLVSCGGSFDAATGNYEDNIIAYGTLRSLRKL